MTTPRNGGCGKPTLLYKRYRDMRSRAHGRGTMHPEYYPPGWPWKDFDEFRTWALKAGFSKERNSPHRPRSEEPYGPDNVIWVTFEENCALAAQKTNGARYGDEKDDDVPF